MQSLLRKVQSLPILSRQEVRPEEPSTLLSHSELLRQIDQVDELIDTMIKESDNQIVLIFPRNKIPENCNSHFSNTHREVVSEALIRRPPPRAYIFISVSCIVA